MMITKKKILPLAIFAKLLASLDTLLIEDPAAVRSPALSQRMVQILARKIPSL